MSTLTIEEQHDLYARIGELAATQDGQTNAVAFASLTDGLSSTVLLSVFRESFTRTMGPVLSLLDRAEIPDVVDYICDVICNSFILGYNAHRSVLETTRLAVSRMDIGVDPAAEDEVCP